MPILLQALPDMRPNHAFRLWLTTIPSEHFSASILQAALKLVMDPPAGLKANLLQVREGGRRGKSRIGGMAGGVGEQGQGCGSMHSSWKQR